MTYSDVTVVQDVSGAALASGIVRAWQDDRDCRTEESQLEEVAAFIGDLVATVDRETQSGGVLKAKVLELLSKEAT